MKAVSRRIRKRKKNISFDAIRRRQIERLAKYLGAADTEDFDRYLIAWHWHNEQSNYPVDALMFAAERMGGSITEERAGEIIKDAAELRQRRTAEALGKYLGLTHAVRSELRIDTIRGTIKGKPVGKKAMADMRK